MLGIYRKIFVFLSILLIFILTKFPDTLLVKFSKKKIAPSVYVKLEVLNIVILKNAVHVKRYINIIAFYCG